MSLSFSNCSLKIITFKNADGIRKDKKVIFLAHYMLHILVVRYRLSTSLLSRSFILPSLRCSVPREAGFCGLHHLGFHTLWLWVGLGQWKALAGDLKVGKGTSHGIFFCSFLIQEVILSFHDNSLCWSGASPWLQISPSSDNIISLLAQAASLDASLQLPQHSSFFS